MHYAHSVHSVFSAVPSLKITTEYTENTETIRNKKGRDHKIAPRRLRIYLPEFRLTVTNNVLLAFGLQLCQIQINKF
jgi:hypothetical protein